MGRALMMLVVAALLSGCSPTATTLPLTPDVRLPTPAELRMPNDPVTGQPIAGAYIAVERSTRLTLDRARENRDPRPLDAAITLGDVLWIDNLTPLTILAQEPPLIWVQVERGKQQGRRGWVQDWAVRLK